MAYKEPGVYLSVVNREVGAFTGVQMLPCIIGPGARIFQKTDTIVRGSTDRDTLSTLKPTSIVKISSYDGGPVAYMDPTDYSLNAEDTIGYVVWKTDKGPAVGDVYYVTYLHEAEDTQYDLNIVFNADSLISMYGDDIRYFESGYPTNFLSLAGQMLFANGAQAVMVCQIRSASEVPTKTEFQAGLDKIAFDERVWRIIPTVVTDDIVSALTRHLIIYSSYEERKERTAFITVPYSEARAVPSKFSGTGGVLDVVGGYASGVIDRRISLCYPDFATMTVSDGSRRQVGGQIIMAAIAGAESAQPLSKSRTRMTFSGFYKLDGVKMTRVEKNALAPMGVTILDQTEPGQDITVRHGVTTDFSNLQSREMSVVAVSDYCAKSFRASCEQYIGKYAISNEVLSMVRGTLEAKVSDLTKAGVILGGTVTSVVQDTNNPDVIASSVRVLVPYPCNYIDITMYLE